MIPKLANRPYFLMESVEECCRECIDGGSSVGDGGGGWGVGGMFTTCLATNFKLCFSPCGIITFSVKCIPFYRPMSFTGNKSISVLHLKLVRTHR